MAKNASTGNTFQTYIRSAIRYLFIALALFTPLLFYTHTSELFEFNKLIFVYIITTLVCFFWAIDTVVNKRFLFKRSIVDIPLTLFLASQGASTLFSIDTRISLLGYYSRWNGGFVSLLCFALLYWSAVTFIDKSWLKKIITAVFISTAITSVWGIFEHFGYSASCLVITGEFNVACWVQDVALRVYATFGQPNWMAAWLVAVLPITWISFFEGSGSISQRFKNKRTILTLLLSKIILIALLFTKSRSGLLGFGVSFLLFAGVSAYITRFSKQFVLTIVTLFVTLGITIFVVGTPWNPSIFELLRTQKAEVTQATVSAPALETGGTESGDIRRIVWQGAVNVWKMYPLLGSGVETFALSYYQGRPIEHNNTSEWNFLYNKAHNEYLNYLATTGALGLISYLLLITVISFQFLRGIRSKAETKDKLHIAALFSGFVSILVTNFFGFSVVTTNILFFLFPAFAISATQTNKENFDRKEIDTTQRIIFGALVIFTGWILISIANYWSTDILYANAQKDRVNQDYTKALAGINKAIENQNEPIYYDFRADLYASLALVAHDAKQEALVTTLTGRAELDLETVRNATSSNIKLLKSRANILSDLAELDQTKLVDLIDTLNGLTKIAPTDPSVFYQRGLAKAKQEDLTGSIKDIELAVKMKPNYKIARKLLSFLYLQNNQKVNAKEQIEYIVKFISPDDQELVEQLKTM